MAKLFFIRSELKLQVIDGVHVVLAFFHLSNGSMFSHVLSFSSMEQAEVGRSFLKRELNFVRGEEVEVAGDALRSIGGVSISKAFQYCAKHVFERAEEIEKKRGKERIESLKKDLEEVDAFKKEQARAEKLENENAELRARIEAFDAVEEALKED